jgi:hypothetical protein
MVENDVHEPIFGKCGFHYAFYWNCLETIGSFTSGLLRYSRED